MDQSITEEVSSIESADVDNPISSPPVLSTEQMETVELDTPIEKLQRQIEELTKQLNESKKEYLYMIKLKLKFPGKSAEKLANDEREKYLQMYNRTNERFIAFEHKQLDQVHRILNNLATDENKTPSGKNQSFLFFLFIFLFI